MKERKFLRFVKNERFIIWVKNEARVPHNKTKIMFFLKPRLFFPRLVFMRKNLENKMCSLNFTCDKNSSMCPKRMFSHWNLPALDFKREKSPEKHFPTLFITYQKTTLHINKDHVLKKNKQTNSPTPQKCHFVSDIKNELSEKIERTQTIYINSWNAVRKVWTEKRPNSFRIWSGSDRVSLSPPGPCLQSIRPPLWSTTLLLLLATSLSPSSSPTLPVLPSASSPSTATQRTRTTGSSPLPGELVPWLWTLEVKK